MGPFEDVFSINSGIWQECSIAMLVYQKGKPKQTLKSAR